MRDETVFGKVVSADDQKVVNAIRQGDKMTKVTIQGDTSALMANADVADRIPKWNSVLDKAANA